MRLWNECHAPMTQGITVYHSYYFADPVTDVHMNTV